MTTSLIKKRDREREREGGDRGIPLGGMESHVN
jgi:hypothetical protein